jgi:hypothetical protein
VTTLVTEPLTASISQDFTVDINERIHVGAFLPYLYLHNSPAGTFTITVSGQGGVIYSKSFTSTDIKAALNTTDNYAHVFYPIIPDEPIQISKGDYTISLEASGYTYSNNSFLGWLKQFENIQNENSYNPIAVDSYPVAFRVKVLKEGISW